MATSNFVLKVTDAKNCLDIRRHCRPAGITVRSIIEVFKEGEKAEKTEVGEPRLCES